MSYLTLSDVSKEFKTGSVTVNALSHVSFELENGEFAVVLGSSGAGKTTLLNLLGGMDGATGGEILLDGKNVTALNKKGLTEYRRNDVGFVFQFYNLMPNLTALENVGFGNLNNEKKVKFIFTDENREVELTEYADVRFTGNTAFHCSLKLDLNEGKYDVYLCLYGEENEGEPLYCLQFANDGLWNSALKANKIGSIEIK